MVNSWSSRGVRLGLRSRRVIALIALLFASGSFTGCGGGAVRARREQRDKLVQTSKLYCEFVNGENNPTDVDVALNLAMAQRCDHEQPHSLTTYKTPSEVQGIIYCCGLPDANKAVAAAPKAAPTPAPAKTESVKEPEVLKNDTKPEAKSDSKAKTEAKPDAGKADTKSQDKGPYPKIPDLDN